MFKSVALIGLGIVFGLIFAGISDGNTGNSEPVESGAETENVDSMFSNISEIIMVVDDLDAAMQVQWKEFGIGPWAIWTFDSSTVNDMMMHDRPQDFAVRIGYAKIGNIYWELVEPLDTHSTYYETLRDHGPSLHNIVFEVRDYDETIERMSQLGIGIFNSGNWGGGTVCQLRF